MPNPRCEHDMQVGDCGDCESGAVDAVEASLRNFLSRWTDFTVHGTDLDSQLRGAALIAVRDIRAYVSTGVYFDAGVAAERERIREGLKVVDENYSGAGVFARSVVADVRKLLADTANCEEQSLPGTPAPRSQR